MSHYRERFVHFDGLTKGGKSIWDRKSATEVFEGGKQLTGKVRAQAVQEIMDSKSVGDAHSMFTFEDLSTADAWGRYKEVGPGFPSLFLTFNRSIHNLWASRHMRQFNSDGSVNSFHAGNMKNSRTEPLWVDHITASGPWERLKYDRLVRSSSAREKMANRLCLPYVSNFDLDFVPKNGNGSSFSQRKKKGSEMRVLDRHKEVNAPEFSDEVNLLMNAEFGGLR